MLIVSSSMSFCCEISPKLLLYTELISPIHSVNYTWSLSKLQLLISYIECYRTWLFYYLKCFLNILSHAIFNVILKMHSLNLFTLAEVFCVSIYGNGSKIEANIPPTVANNQYVRHIEWCNNHLVLSQLLLDGVKAFH